MSFKKIIFCCLLTLSPALAVAIPDLAKYSLVFSDEFDNTSATPDANKWVTAPIWGPFVRTNLEEQFYVDTNGINQGFGHNPFEVSNGTLKITAQTTLSTLPAPNQPLLSDPVWNLYDYQFNPNYDSADSDYLSGIITSTGSFDFTHGYIEMNARIPSGQGLWPAFRLLTTKYVEDIPEIDIMENLGARSDEVTHVLRYVDITNNSIPISSPAYTSSGSDFSQDFHTYAVLWEPRKLTWLVDGVAVRTVTDDDFLIPKQSMYIMTSLAVGGTWPGSPDASTQFPATLEIDYIRAYEKIPPTVITPTVLSDEYEIIFEDNFDPLAPAVDIHGTGIDPTKWNTQFLWGPYHRINLENQFYIDSHGRHQQYANHPFQVVDDGAGNSVLRISAIEVEQSELPVQPPLSDAIWQQFPQNQYNLDYLQPTGWEPFASSGMITSYDAFKVVNGYVEFRAKVPVGDGLWPALWLLNGYYVGPSPEIDVMELQGEDPGTIHHSYHYNDSLGMPNSSTAVFNIPGGNGNFGADYHTYGVQWDRGKIQWYIDGSVTHVLEGPEVSTQLMYIIMNLAVGGTFVNYSGIDALPADFDIDYVRAYQRKSEIAELAEKRVGSGMTVKGTLVKPNDVDKYAFTALAGQTLQFDIDIPNGNLDSILRIFDASGTELSINDNAAGPSPEYSTLESYASWTAPADATYYIGVSSQSNLAYQLNDNASSSSGMSTGNYELTIRPSIELANPNPATGDRMGFSVAIDGNYAVIGSRMDDAGGIPNSGSADVFQSNGDGTWSHVKTLVSGTPHASALFGHSVSISGDHIVVGEEKQISAGLRAGAIWIFQKDKDGANNWGATTTTPIIGNDSLAGDYFGRSVDIDGNTLVVGALNADTNGNNSGAAYVIDLNTGNQVKLVPNDASSGDNFGNAVGISGDTIVVGSFRDDDIASGSGSSYVFNRDTGGVNNWGQLKKLVASDAAANDQFGYSVDIEGNAIVVGARFADVGSLMQTGAIYTFEQGAGGAENWGQTQRIVADNPTAGDRLGSSVSINGEKILVGAPLHDEFGDKSGKAYVFTRNETQWYESNQLYNDQTSLRDEFGIAVAIDDNRGLIGSWLDNRPAGGFINSGSAYIFGL